MCESESGFKPLLVSHKSIKIFHYGPKYLTMNQWIAHFRCFHTSWSLVSTYFREMCSIGSWRLKAWRHACHVLLLIKSLYCSWIRIRIRIRADWIRIQENRGGSEVSVFGSRFGFEMSGFAHHCVWDCLPLPGSLSPIVTVTYPSKSEILLNPPPLVRSCIVRSPSPPPHRIPVVRAKKICKEDHFLSVIYVPESRNSTKK